jgi:hypothetical protein
MNKVKEYWETSDDHMSHLSLEYIKGNITVWKNKFLNSIDFKDKVVIDYETGRGLLGEVLHKEYMIKKYIGIDVAEKQLNFAKEILKDTNSEFYLTPINFKELGADIFITQAVIQHFVDEKYLIDFLNNINESNCDKLVLHIRHGEKTIFKNGYDNKDRNDIRINCYTNKEYIEKYLIKYKLIYQSGTSKSKTQYLIYDKI